MNATVMEHDIIKCDAPPAAVWPREGEETPKQFTLEITLDGRELNGPAKPFIYYKDPEITKVSPTLGPAKGGTSVTIEGVGFRQEGVCNATVRFGTVPTKPDGFNDTMIVVKSPPVDTPDASVVSVALNGQQYIKEKILHF